MCRVLFVVCSVLFRCALFVVCWLLRVECCLVRVCVCSFGFDCSLCVVGSCLLIAVCGLFFSFFADCVLLVVRCFLFVVGCVLCVVGR